jgi:hypothetical protein
MHLKMYTTVQYTIPIPVKYLKYIEVSYREVIKSSLPRAIVLVLVHKTLVFIYFLILKKTWN